MEKILDYLKWIIPSQGIGLLCMFLAYFIPEAYLGHLNQYLFIFGFILTLGYWFYLIVNVYNKLKKKAE